MPNSKMEVNRRGTVTEYKRGHHYLTHTEWEDGHCEIEIHKCEPELKFHSCDPHELPTAFQEFQHLAEGERAMELLIEAQDQGGHNGRDNHQD